MKRKIIYSSISVLVIFIGVVFLISINNKGKNEDSENININDSYINNNPYNKNLTEYSKDKETEKAEYSKYITDEANNKLINQLVSVEIKQTKKIDEIEKSSSTDKIKERIFLLEDYNKNSWIFSKEGATWIDDNQNDLVVYGKYLGIIDYKGVKYPKIDIQFVSKNIVKLEKEKYKDVAEKYIDSLQNIYQKEKLAFKDFNVDTTKNELIYENDNKKINLHIIVNDENVLEVYVDIKSPNIKIESIDEEFLKAILISFNQSIDGNIATELLKEEFSNFKELKKHAYDNGYQIKKTTYNNVIIEEGITETTLHVYYDK